MSDNRKVNAKSVPAGLVIMLLLIITFHISAKDKRHNFFFKSLTVNTDTTQPDIDSTPIKIIVDSTLRKDSTISDSTLFDSSKQKIDTLTISKDSLDAPIEYAAEDSGVLMMQSKEFILYGKANVKSKDADLTAATIRYDQQSQMIKAYGGIDTSNNPLSKPTIVQNGATAISDTIIFNTRNQKGITKNVFYNESEMFVNAVKVKKIEKDVSYAYRARFTTCNLDTPHFDFRAKRVKFITNKIAVTGPAQPEFEGVPIPVVLPFGLFPLNTGRHSGVLPPQFTSNQSYGLGLEGLGYYKVMNDYWDVTVRTNIYSYGGYSMDINPKYFKRYKYNGGLTLSIQNTKLLNNGVSAVSKDEFSSTKGLFITWNHSQDSKARPGTSFSASVRAGSTKFNQYIPNNTYRNFENQLSSSITYAKSWNQGKYNLSMAANHDQNNNLRLINIRLPTVNFSATTIYPFQRREQAGTPKWFEKLGISYTGTFLNQFSFYDSAFNFKKLLDTAQFGAQHTIPISISLPPVGPLLFSPSISYGERWYGQKIEVAWNQKRQRVDTSIQKGFFTAREVSFGMSMNTRIFGTYLFGKNSNIVAIRHEVKPFVSMNYKPDLVSKYYQKVQVDTNRTHLVKRSVFDGGVMGSYGQGTFGGLNFGIDNLLEMKVRDKKDTSAEANKKVKLIDGLSINSGYNFLADSLQWSNINMSFRSTLFGNVNITGGASIDPYGTDSLGNRINYLLWKHGSLGRFNTANLAISTSLKSKSKDGKKPEDRIVQDETISPDEQMRQLNYVKSNPSEFVDFNIPWNVQMSFSLNFYRTRSANFKSIIQAATSLNLNGDFSLSPKWKLGGSTYFDIKTQKIQTLTMFITREMHCWQMAINITPVGLYKSFSIVLNPKSGLLRDLKINRSRFYYNN